jgi:hypothetical protein
MAQTPGARSPLAETLRFGAVLAASGPVILSSFGVGRESFGYTCYASYAGPSALESTSWDLLFCATLLLPVVLAGLLLRGPRRATTMAVSAVGAVLAFGLFVAVSMPGTHPCTGEAFPVRLPWYLVACYVVAIVSLLLAARSPLPEAGQPVTLWAVAAVAATWATGASFLPFAADGPLTTVTWDSTWDLSEMFASDAERIGLPIMVVALAAAARGVAPGRPGRLAGLVAGAFLLGFALLSLLTRYGNALPGEYGGLIRWPLLLAAVLVLLATWRQVRASGRLAPTP